MALNREQLAALKQQPAATRSVPVEAWGCDVLVRGLSYSGRVELARKLDLKPDEPVPAIYGVALVAHSCVDDAGELLFSDADIAWLDTQADAIGDLLPVARELAGIQPDAVQQEKKDLKATAGSISATPSPLISASPTLTGSSAA